MGMFIISDVRIQFWLISLSLHMMLRYALGFRTVEDQYTYGIFSFG